MDPTRFNDADGNFAGDIGDWLVDNGYHDFVGTTGDDDDVCGNSASDGWGFIDFQCIEAGYFHIDILPPGGSSISQGLTLKFFCAGQADTATIGASRSVVEIEPQAGSDDESLITVTVLDPDGRRIDNVEVQFLTDNCYFTGQDSPAGGQPTVVTAFTDTDATSADQYFLTNNPLEHSAGTAEVVLNCSKATAGDANVRAVIQRAGADIVLDVTVKVVGTTAANGLTLTLAPKELQCGDTLTARAQAVDVNGEPVSDGTTVRFTSDTSSGVVGGFEGAQGGIGTVDGSAQVLIATDPGKPGVHTVVAYVFGNDGRALAQIGGTYTCQVAFAGAHAAPATNRDHASKHRRRRPALVKAHRSHALHRGTKERPPFTRMEATLAHHR